MEVLDREPWKFWRTVHENGARGQAGAVMAAMIAAGQVEGVTLEPGQEEPPPLIRSNPEDRVDPAEATQEEQAWDEADLFG